MGIDYKTKPISRKKIREYSEFIRKDLGLKDSKILIEDLMNKLFSKYDVTFLIEEDEEFPNGVVCYLDFINEKAFIHIRNSVYENACCNDHKSIGFIIHEICHFYLIKVFEYYPVNDIKYTSGELDNYISVERQAKALCGEFMIPYERFKDKTVEEIINETNSSFSQANYFKNVVCAH